MANISELRNGIATNLATISGLRTSSSVPELVNPPIAIIIPENVSYHRAFNNALSEYTFTVTVIVGRQDARTSQASLDNYASATGTQSIRRAIESDKTLGGKAFDTVVTEMRDYGATSIGETTYLMAAFAVAVQAD